MKNDRIGAFALGISFIALLATGSAGALAQPQPAPTTSARDYDNRIRQQARNNTLVPPPPQYDASGNRILQEGPDWLRNVNDEQRERINDALRQSVAESGRRIQSDLPNLSTQLNNRAGNIERGLEGVASALDPNASSAAREAVMNDPNYARNLSRGVLTGVDQIMAVEQDLGQTMRPTLASFSEAMPGYANAFTDVARQNGASAAEIAQMQREVAQMGNLPGQLNNAFDREDYQVQDFRRRLTENRQQYEDRLTVAVQNVIQQYGPDPVRWPQNALPGALSAAVPGIPPTAYLNSAQSLGVDTSGIRGAASRATGGLLGGGAPARAPSPAPGPAAAGTGSASSAGPANGSTGQSGTANGAARSGSTGTASGAGTRGSGAGTQGDLSQGPRVPASQGGTGAETPASRQAAQQRANQEAQAQERQRAEAQAERTERLRQAAMAQARRDNEGGHNPQSAPIDQPAPARSDRVARDNELGMPDLEGRTPPPPPSGDGDGAGDMDPISAAAAAMANAGRAAAAASAFDEVLRRHRGGLGRIGGGATGGAGESGSTGDGWFDWLRNSAEPAQTEAEAAAAAAARQREAARLDNERQRIRQAAEERVNRDANWNAMVAGRFDSNRMWEEFRLNGGTLTTLELEDIYRNYDPRNSIPPAQSLSSAPTSLSAAGRSLSAAGTPVRSGTDDYEDPAVQSLYEALYGLTSRRRGPLGPTEEEIQTANMGDFDLHSDPTGRWGRESGGYLAANLFDQEVDYLTRSIVNGRGGLSALLAQPFNVILTWGAGAYDLDLHMTGPTGLGESDRFHIYYSATGSLTGFPYAALIKDCICSAGSEVILTTTLLGGGVYRVSVFNFGDQAANSNNLSNFSNATIQIVRGGVATSQGNGTTITGGHVILTTNVPIGQFGNTWIAAELDPRTGRITVPRMILQSQDSAHVR